MTQLPEINLRRQPTLAFVNLFLGLLILLIGVYISNLFVIFSGVFPILLAGMMMLNAFAVLSNETVELKNVFGLTRASHGHDGLHLIQVIDDVIYIQKGDMRAPLKRIVKRRINHSDWAAMLKTLDEIKAIQAQKGKSKGRV